MARHHNPKGSNASPTPMGTTQTAIAASLARAQRPVILESASSASSDTGVSENSGNAGGISLVDHQDTSNISNMNADGHGISGASGVGPSADGSNQDYHGAHPQHQVHDASYHAHYPTTQPQSVQQAAQFITEVQDHQANHTGDYTGFTTPTNGSTFGYGGHMDGSIATAVSTPPPGIPGATIVTSPVHIHSPGPFSTPRSYRSPIALQSPGQIRSPGQVHTPGQIRHPGQVHTPVQVRSPAQFHTPVQARSPGPVHSPSVYGSSSLAHSPAGHGPPNPYGSPNPYSSPDPYRSPTVVNSPELYSSPVLFDSPPQVHTPLPFNSPSQVHSPLAFNSPSAFRHEQNSTPYRAPGNNIQTTPNNPRFPNGLNNLEFANQHQSGQQAQGEGIAQAFNDMSYRTPRGWASASEGVPDYDHSPDTVTTPQTALRIDYSQTAPHRFGVAQSPVGSPVRAIHSPAVGFNGTASPAQSQPFATPPPVGRGSYGTSPYNPFASRISNVLNPLPPIDPAPTTAAERAPAISNLQLDYDMVAHLWERQGPVPPAIRAVRSNELNQLTDTPTGLPSSLDALESTIFPFVHCFELAPGPSPFGVIKIKNIPYNTMRSEILAMVGRTAKLPQDMHEPVHIIMDKVTSKTQDAYVEFTTKADAKRAVDRFDELISKKRQPRLGQRPIDIELSSQDALLKDLFPFAYVTWKNGVPHVKPTVRGQGWTQFKGIITIEEVTMLIKFVEYPHRSPFARDCPQRPFESYISTIKKLPWYSPDIVTMQERHLLASAGFKLIHLLRRTLQHPKHDHSDARINEQLLKRMLTAFMLCPGFSATQKDNAIVGAGYTGDTSVFNQPRFAHDWVHLHILVPKPGLPMDVLEWYIAVVREESCRKLVLGDPATYDRAVKLRKEVGGRGYFGFFWVEMELPYSDWELGKMTLQEVGRREIALVKHIIDRAMTSASPMSPSRWGN